MGQRFSFDIGTNSIGFAIWRTGLGDFGPDTPLELKLSGVRIFKDGRNPKDKQSLAVMRRLPRQARKRRDRFVERRRALMAALISAGLLPSDERQRKELQEVDPYQLRAKALDERLALGEIGRVLFHLNQRRGFRSNRKADRKSGGESGKIATAAKHLEKLLNENSCRTLGEFLWLRHRGASGDPKRVRDPERKSTRIRMEGEGSKALYDFYPTREMVRAEFEAVWAAQAFHYPEALTEDARKRISDILFRQRELKPPKVGRCTFVVEELRIPKALPSVEAREIYERLAHVRLSEAPMMERPLSSPERDVIASALLAGKNLTYPQIRKALKLGGHVRINFEEVGETGLEGSQSAKFLTKKNHIGNRWLSMPFEEKDAFVYRLLDEPDEEELVEELSEGYGLSKEAARECATIPLKDGYSRLGATANNAILEELREGVDEEGRVIPYSEAVKRAGWHHSDERDGEIYPSLPYYGQVLQRHVMPGSLDPEDKHDDAAYWGRITNPTVHIGMNQLRRIVNALVREYGHPDQVVVELTRELKQNNKQKEREQKQNKANREANEKRVARLQELGQVDNADNRTRLRLFEEQGGANKGIVVCPYSGRTISLSSLFSSEIEVDHILPISQTLDDTLGNRVLCFREANRNKRQKTPFEAFGGSPEWYDIAARAESLPVNKRWRFKPDALEQFQKDGGFLARQLNETKYLSRLAKAYLGRICDPDQVYVTPGTLVGLLRGKWGLNSILSDANQKERTDHRHHAIDAIVIGTLTRGLINRIARDAGRAEDGELSKVFDKIPTPFDYAQFRDAIRNSVEKSSSPSRRNMGSKGRSMRTPPTGSFQTSTRTVLKEVSSSGSH